MIVSALLLLPAGLVWGQVVQTHSGFTMAGGMSAASQITNVMTAGQSHAGEGRGGSLVNYGGFIQSVPLKPGLDHDGDGLPDEMDLDNDNDLLEDSVEIEGSSFSPPVPTEVNDPDTDNDGQADGAEWIADTSPTNTTSALVITGLKRQGGGLQVEWSGGASARQILLRKESLTSPEEWKGIFTNQPPTTLATNVVDQVTHSASFYKIQAERP